jgi:acyl carrier protein
MIYTRAEVENKINKILVKNLDVDESKVTDSADFVKDLGADSLDRVELTMAFEEEFVIEIPDDATEKIVTVKDAVDFVVTHRCRPGP